jgi:hypothetical protein
LYWQIGEGHDMTNPSTVARLGKIVVTVLVALATPMVDASRALSQPSGAQRLALLVGCTDYPALPQKFWLNGPSNDVQLARGLLVDRFGFAESDIVTLVHENAPERRPSRANIEREFQRLVSFAKLDGFVFILLAGHGSRQPDDDSDDQEEPETDGLDEVFLPEDVPAWDGSEPAVKAITDDELRAWISAIRAKGASVFFVADTCHSGSIDRGPAEREGFAKSRQLPSELLFDPGKLAESAKRSKSSERENLAVGPNSPSSDPDGRLVSLYAVQSDQPEQEHKMPPKEAFNDPCYGRLTYALVQVLSNANQPLTYNELRQRLRWQYEHWGWLPMCYLQTGDESQDQEVLGRGIWKGRSNIVVTRSRHG